MNPLLPWLAPERDRMVKQIESGRLPHSMLIHGPSGVGKRNLVGHLVGMMHCTHNDVSARPCGNCRDCQLLNGATHPDVRHVGLEEKATQVKVDQIRNLVEKIALTSSRGEYQSFVVDPADRMNRSAANAFLKTLEEPSSGTLIVLVADSSNRLPATILSRCQRRHIEPPPVDAALAWLKSVSNASESSLGNALASADRAPLRALRLLERGQENGLEQTGRDVLRILDGRTSVVEIARQWKADDPIQRLRWLNQLLVEVAWGRVDSTLAGRLTARHDLASLGAIYQRVLAALRDWETSLRPELILESTLVAVTGDT